MIHSVPKEEKALESIGSHTGEFGSVVVSLSKVRTARDQIDPQINKKLDSFKGLDLKENVTLI